MLGTLLETLDLEDVGLTEIIGRFSNLEDQLEKDLDVFEENLPEIIYEIEQRTKNKGCHIFVQTLYDPFEGNSIEQLAELSQKETLRLNQIINDCSESGERYIVADVANVFKGRREELVRMDVHPNAEGHKVIADVLQPLISSQTYSYYDAESAMIYEQHKQQQEQEEKRERKRKLIIVAAASVAVFAVLGAYGAYRRVKTGSKKTAQ